MNPKNLFNNIIFEKIISEKDIDIKNILKIRNEKKVRNAMIKNEIIVLDKHIDWISEYLKNNKKIFYKIKFLKKLIGLITLDINEKKNYSWAFYISEKAKKGLGALIELKFLDHFFFRLLKKDLECQVLSFNQSVIKLHLRYGFKIIEIKKNFISRFKKKHDLIYFHLGLKTWKLKREEIYQRLNISY